jgi:UDP-GlcNAc:undecaprenyl-phosphate GlcNAc-1-phosphate transferase
VLSLTLTPVAGFAVAFVLAWAATPLARWLAIVVGAIDRPGARKLHAADVPRLGGLAIALGFLVPILLLALRVNLFQGSLYSEPRRLSALLGGGLVILSLGVYDDLQGARAFEKLVVQIPVAALAWWAGLRIGGTAAPSGALVSFAPALSLLVTVGWFVVAINAVNLIDGLDGLASGIALQALAAMGLCAWLRGEPVLALVAVVLAGAVAGFLLHNFHPATIYMGDSGSMFLGWVLAGAAVWSSQKAATAVTLVLPALALGVPLLDTGLAVWRRLLHRKPIMTGDLDHLHHRLLATGYTQPQAVWILYAVSLSFSALSVGVALWGNDRRFAWAALATAAVVALGFSRWLGYPRPRAGGDARGR